MSSNLSIFSACQNESLASAHTAEVSSGAMAELFRIDGQFWDMIANGWDVNLALDWCEGDWDLYCRNPKVKRLKPPADPDAWERRMLDYTFWRLKMILGEESFSRTGEAVREPGRGCLAYHLAIVNDDGMVQRGGLLLGPFKVRPKVLKGLMRQLNSYYHLDFPHLLGDGLLSVDLVGWEVKAPKVPGRLNGHPVFEDTYGEAYMSQFLVKSRKEA